MLHRFWRRVEESEGSGSGSDQPPTPQPAAGGRLDTSPAAAAEADTVVATVPASDIGDGVSSIVIVPVPDNELWLMTGASLSEVALCGSKFFFCTGLARRTLAAAVVGDPQLAVSAPTGHKTLGPRIKRKPRTLQLGDPTKDMRWIFAGADKVTGKFHEGESIPWQHITVEQKNRASDILALLGSTRWPAGAAVPASRQVTLGGPCQCKSQWMV